MENIKELKEFLRKYSLDDLAKGFFALNLWLPNIASPIKIQYLYVILESMHNELSAQNRIVAYSDYQEFCTKLFELVPSFIMLEDYVPEADWKDVRYFFEKRFYDIFYGGDLSNPYDYYYEFEIIHKAFKDTYVELIKRSPMDELRFCLSIQNNLINSLNQDKSEKIENIRPGDIGAPSEKFWQNVCNFIDGYNPETAVNSEMLSFYVKDLTDNSFLPNFDTFTEDAFRGKNCRYFFIFRDGKYYPVMPRSYITVLYDTWGILLSENYKDISKALGNKDPDILIGIEMYKFIGDRVNEDNVFPMAKPLELSGKPYDLVFTAIHVEDTLLLVHVIPPIYDQETLDKHLSMLMPKIKECNELFSKTPTKFYLMAKNQIVEFRSKKQKKSLRPVFFIALPTPLTSSIIGVEIPRDVPIEIMGIDQIAGIFDEAKDPEEIIRFFDSLESERKQNYRMAPLNTYLDRFGSFRDSHEVLIPGALEPDMISLDTNWGSSLRFRSLKEFWDDFPDESFFGNPRSWKIPSERKSELGLMLESRNFFGYVYCQKIGSMSFFINSPVDKMSWEQGKMTDLLMHSISDSIELYRKNIEILNFAKHKNKTQVFLCPASLVLQSGKFEHLKHLISTDDPWEMDFAPLGAGGYGIRIVYKDDKIVDNLKTVNDRSLQMELIIGIIDQMNSWFQDKKAKDVIKELDDEKHNPSRFRMFQIEKKASFPENVRAVIPQEREYKMADKDIAKIALALGIAPGEYSSEEAKEKLNSLIAAIINHINKKVLDFSFRGSLGFLLEKIDALINDYGRNEAEIKNSLEHEVDYERSERLVDQKTEFISQHRDCRYLVEKFVQLQPKGKKIIDEFLMRELLALINRILNVYTASDFIHYELYPVRVIIDRDYIVSIKYVENLSEMEKVFSNEQSKLRLGLIGNSEDIAESTIPIENYLDELDIAFKKDFGFGLRNLVNVHQVLGLWAMQAEKKEKTYYMAKANKIAAVCSKQIKGYDKSETEAILEFLTLKPDEILNIQGDPVKASDLPVWEYYKRIMRYSIKPLIKLGSFYCWGPHSVEKASWTWINITSEHQLPADFSAPLIVEVLKKGHENLEKELVQIIKKIVLRYTQKVETDIFPHKYDGAMNDIGDFDVLGYLDNKNILLNIEAKIIGFPRCHKDSGRMQRKIYVSRNSEDGKVKRSYLKKVEDRADYLKSNSKDIIRKLGWTVPSTDPQILSIFVTKVGFWWTKHPPIKTDVKFVEARLLDDFIKNL